MFHAFRISFVTAALTALSVTVLTALAADPQPPAAGSRTASVTVSAWPESPSSAVRVIDLRRPAR